MKPSIENMRAQLIWGKRLADIPLRATYYARVSTDRDEQLSSLYNQKAYFEEKIRANPAWIFVPGYVDEGVTGTSTKKRTEFLRMVADAKAGLFDLILTKEVSRFARDLLDSIAYTRELLHYDVGVVFEDTGLNTIDADSEFRLAIMATVAQEESRKLSERVKFGWKRAQEAGKRHGAVAPVGYVFNNKINGYDIDPETAPAVQYIYRRYAENIVGTRTIAQELKDRGYVNLSGNAYYPSTIRRIIENPLYKGYIVSRKSVSISYRSQKKQYNPPVEWLLHYDPCRVPPLVTEDEWDAANRVARLRGEFMKGIDCGAYHKSGGKYPYTGKIFCSAHHCNYQRAQQQWNADGEPKKRSYWRCACYKRPEQPSICDAPRLYTDQLDRMMRELFRILIDESLGSSLPDVVKSALSARDCSAKPEKFTQRLLQLQNKKAKLVKGWLDGVIQDADYRVLDQEISGKIAALEAQKMCNPVPEQVDLVDLERSMHENAAINTPEALEELIRCLVHQIRVEPVPDEAGAYILKVVLDIPGVAFSGTERFVVCDPKGNLPRGSGT